MKTPNYSHRIAKEYDGCLPYHEIFYIRSIRFSADRALGAFNRYYEEIEVPATAQRAEELHDDDPLLNVRLIRNAIEHFDERLDCFCSRDPVGTIFDLIVGSEALADEQVTHVLRLVDPASEIIILFGKKYQFAGLHRSVERIHGIANMMDREGGRLRSSERKSNGENAAS
jgi:hypothetical protein